MSIRNKFKNCLHRHVYFYCPNIFSYESRLRWRRIRQRKLNVAPATFTLQADQVIKNSIITIYFINSQHIQYFTWFFISKINIPDIFTCYIEWKKSLIRSAINRLCLYYELTCYDDILTPFMVMKR